MKDLFELELLGGAAGRLYRRKRPAATEMPWGTLAAHEHDPALVAQARRSWSEGAYSEYATAAAFATLLRCLLEARAPIDLVGMAGDFIADEILHTELNARMAMELGGAPPILVDFAKLAPEPDPSLSPRLRAVALAVEICCVGEALSVPVLSATLRAASHPLTRAVLAQIAADEGPHATLGWEVLAWADAWLDDEHRRLLSGVATAAVERYADELATDGTSSHADDALTALGWLPPAQYGAQARSALERAVRAPLARHGITLSAAIC